MRCIARIDVPLGVFVCRWMGAMGRWPQVPTWCAQRGKGGKDGYVSMLYIDTCAPGWFHAASCNLAFLRVDVIQSLVAYSSLMLLHKLMCSLGVFVVAGAEWEETKWSSET